MLSQVDISARPKYTERTNGRTYVYLVMTPWDIQLWRVTEPRVFGEWTKSKPNNELGAIDDPEGWIGYVRDVQIQDVEGRSTTSIQHNLPRTIRGGPYTMATTNINATRALQPIRKVVSASGLYPLKGIYYFLAHREYYPLFARRLIPLTITSIVVLTLLFTFTYLPQAAFLRIFHGPTAWVSAAFLVLGEGTILIALLFEAFLVDETLVDVFDATLIREGYTSLVSPSRILHHDAPTAVQQLGRPTSPAEYSPFSFRQILELILFLPINFIPVIGTPFFLLLTGARAGPFHHYRWFQLRGLTKKEKKREIRIRKWKYTWFGTVALLLQLVPVFSMFFLLTSACGSALWVVKLEEQKRLIEEAPVVDDTMAASVDNTTDYMEEPPPPYTDDPI
ncbi:hypothetical protein G7Y89_g4324 [Cudoniella acicularis]|uniref:Uncharacterized protein n=1 Tax=Cudoniella acicularis TaxID=354080 RepID=A0A8H4W7K5_9HELO|nr:hypothetical protein G7Y89_g4324 [Cudoniella acicularis]